MTKPKPRNNDQNVLASSIILVIYCTASSHQTFLLLLVSVAAALARPQAPPSIIRNIRFEPDDDGHYEFEIETSDGLRRSETGSQTGPESQTIKGVIS